MRAQRAGRRIGSFDRTYEGLKPTPAAGSARAAPRTFDRTYEGLKLGEEPLCWLPVAGF